MKMSRWWTWMRKLTVISCLLGCLTSWLTSGVGLIDIIRLKPTELNQIKPMFNLMINWLNGWMKMSWRWWWIGLDWVTEGVDWAVNYLVNSSGDVRIGLLRGKRGKPRELTWIIRRLLKRLGERKRPLVGPRMSRMSTMSRMLRMSKILEGGGEEIADGWRRILPSAMKESWGMSRESWRIFEDVERILKSLWRCWKSFKESLRMWGGS